MAGLLILTFILAPAYALRFNLPHLPANILMVWVFLFWIVFFVYLILSKQVSVFLTAVKKTDKKLLLFAGLIFLGGLNGLFLGSLDRAKIGQFIVLFLQPIPTFFIARFIFFQKPEAKNYLLLSAYSLLALAGALAILQYFTLLTLPPAFWGNSQEPKRALAFFIHPNFYALWAAPLLALLIPDLAQSLKSKVLSLKSVAWLLGGLGLLLSFSRAGWAGLVAAVVIYLIFAADKKIRRIIFAAAIVVVLVIFVTPNLRWRFILPFRGEKSADSRIELWQSGWQGIKQSPILGLGLNGYANQYRALQTDTSLPDHNFPHNIFLDFWIETGLLGLISFLAIAYLYISRGLKNCQDLLALGVSLFLVAMIVQGQIDNPYFKNDLALVFWLVLALI